MHQADRKMKILFVIAHFFNPLGKDAPYGSLRNNPQERVNALTQSLYSLHQIFGSSQGIYDLINRKVNFANQIQTYDIDVVICTTENYHLVKEILIADDLWMHHATGCEPRLLPLECQALMRDCLGMYDYYCYLEDDTVIHDPWLFIKLAWFNQKFGDLKLLQPNRYQLSTNKSLLKAYPDGYLPLEITAAFQNVAQEPELREYTLSQEVLFYRASNPVAGCYVLNERQLEFWAQQSYFLEDDTSFFGPLESAMYLGIMKTFQIYKPAESNASFLEVEHFGNSYLQFS